VFWNDYKHINHTSTIGCNSDYNKFTVKADIAKNAVTLLVRLCEYVSVDECMPLNECCMIMIFGTRSILKLEPCVCHRGKFVEFTENHHLNGAYKYFKKD
jgi:hypothetical protein